MVAGQPGRYRSLPKTVRTWTVRTCAGWLIVERLEQCKDIHGIKSELIIELTDDAA